jgi:uncharacterized protein (DUF305 family)
VTRVAWRLAILLMLSSGLDLFALQTGSHLHRGEAAPGSDWSELMASMETMHDHMESVKRSGDSDTDFVRLMLPHHQAAIDMAKAQLIYGKDPQMQRLAQEIITDQQSEIELMKLWLEQRESRPRSASHSPGLHTRKEQ